MKSEWAKDVPVRAFKESDGGRSIFTIALIEGDCYKIVYKRMAWYKVCVI